MTDTLDIILDAVSQTVGREILLASNITNITTVNERNNGLTADKLRALIVATVLSATGLEAGKAGEAGEAGETTKVEVSVANVQAVALALGEVGRNAMQGALGLSLKAVNAAMTVQAIDQIEGVVKLLGPAMDVLGSSMDDSTEGETQAELLDALDAVWWKLRRDRTSSSTSSSASSSAGLLPGLLPGVLPNIPGLPGLEGTKRRRRKGEEKEKKREQKERHSHCVCCVLCAVC